MEKELYKSEPGLYKYYGKNVIIMTKLGNCYKGYVDEVVGANDSDAGGQEIVIVSDETSWILFERDIISIDVMD